MAVRDWLKRLLGTGSDGASPLASAPRLAPASKVRPGKGDAIAYAVNLAGLVNDQSEAMAFYQSAFANWAEPTFRNLEFRKQGDLLDKDALKALGLRANVKLSAQFLATLNERGRADALEAASVIGCTISTTLCTLRDLANMEVAGIEFVEFHASPMAAGPCAEAARMDGQTLPIGEAQLLPLKSCPHGGQCGCMYQSRLSLTGEF